MKKPLYLFSNGQISRKDNTVYFDTGKEKKYVPIEGISDLYILGEVDVTKKFLELASQTETLIHFFNYYGYYVGTFYPREHLNSGYLLLRQAEHYLDPEKRIRLAALFVSGATRNIRQVIKYYMNRGISGLEPTLSRIDGLAETISNVRQAKEQEEKRIEELMALEGNIRESYYSAFDRIIKNPDFRFGARSRRPPRNNLNALISFGNSLLYTAVLSEIYKTHLDPRIGYLHATNFRRFTLNLDVAEVFKPVIVDRVIFTLVDRGVLSNDDFEEESGGIMMKEAARKKFVAEFDKRMETVITHRKIGRPVSYRRLIRLELYKVEKHLMGEQEYEPFSSQW
ncbi:MAG TPA: type I-B CRISPR-associated endonuclease Cas1 [Firmicutes bacterium]|nr:type I-B CRISPR-associated endonuclease Cas1 [Bacillota bacterium]